MTKPIMLLDVDGPLNPYAAKPTRRPEGFETHRTYPRGWETGKGLRVWLNPSHGPKLMDCGYDIVWCTAWEDEANEWIGPHIGLPELPAIEWGPHETYLDKKLHWKTHQIATYMQENHPGVPFIWVDDEATKKDEEYLETKLDIPLKVCIIDPKTGLEDKDFDKMTEWAAKHNEG
jgi:hypothetical protein